MATRKQPTSSVSDREDAPALDPPIEQLLQNLTAGVSATTGEQFFESLVHYLAKTLDMEQALIGELVDRDTVRVIKSVDHGQPDAVLEYALTDTPCANVVESGYCAYPHGVRERFPRDSLLARLRIESYFGAPLRSSAGDAIGLMIVMDTRPVRRPRLVERLFHVFAARAASELERQQALASLHESEARFRTLVEHAPEAIVLLDADKQRFVEVNDNAVRLFGFTRDELLERGPAELSPPRQPDGRSSSEAATHWIRQALTGRAPAFEWVHVNALGDEIPTEVRLVQLPGSGGVMLRGSITDIRDRKQTETHMAKLSHALEQSADLVMITSRNGVIEYVNPSFEQVTGYGVTDVIGEQPNLLRSGRHDRGFYERLWATISAGDVFRDVVINRRKDGSLFYEDKTITPLTDPSGTVTHYVSTGKDITDQIRIQERVRHLACHDALTDLPNRTLLTERLDSLLKTAPDSDTRVAVILLDLDRFKIINDTLGHEAGDQVLRVSAQRLSSTLGPQGLVTRLGGDEFAALIEDAGTRDELLQVATTISAALSEPIEAAGRQLYIDVSIGVSCYPEDGEDGLTLLRNADIALYHAKEQRKGGCQFYAPDMGEQAVERLGIETALRQALERQEFLAYYQPQVSVDGERIVGVEALLRWSHAEWGLITPNQFIRVTEETGLIVSLDAWMLRTACGQAQAWAQAGTPVRIAVNISARQLCEPDFVGRVERALEQTGLDPSRLELELTEHAVVQHMDRAVSNLTSLAERGIRIAIDDFGTGYSSLSYLSRLPFHTLKIDKTFVHNAVEHAGTRSIINGIVAMARDLDLRVVAEGVENARHLELLRECGCDAYQGYLCHYPMPAEGIQRLLGRHRAC